MTENYNNQLINDILLLANIWRDHFMVEAIATATEIKNNFGKYLDMVSRGNEVIITKNGKEIGRMIPRSQSVSFLTDSLTGIIHGNDDIKEEKEKAVSSRYAVSD
jgi:prevent-host-death family protein